jgi:hypothetical protein
LAARLDLAKLAAVKEDLDEVRALHREAIRDLDPAWPLFQQDPAPVDDGVGQARVAVVPPHELVAVSRRARE